MHKTTINKERGHEFERVLEVEYERVWAKEKEGQSDKCQKKLYLLINE